MPPREQHENERKIVLGFAKQKSLVDAISIATVHVVIKAERVAEVNTILESVRATFHKFDIHVSTIQPELSSLSSGEDLAAGCVISGGNPCAEECGAEPCCPDDVHEQNELRRRKFSVAVN